MQGLFSDVPLIGVISLIHETQQTGRLDVEAEVPFNIDFSRGEIVEGGILEWTGLEALHACPLLPHTGSFKYTRTDVLGLPFAPFEQFSTDWARISDEWEQIIKVIGSPSAVFSGEPLFNLDFQPGLSVRDAAQQARVSLFEMAARAADAVQKGALQPTGAYEWFNLKVQHQGARDSELSLMLSGALTLGQIIDLGFGSREVRQYLLTHVRQLHLPQRGWVLRDITWESRDQHIEFFD